MAEVKFLEVLNELSPAFTSGLQSVAGREIAEQLDRVIIPVQRIGGVPENFSLLIFPFPRLTPEEVKDMPLVDELSYVFSIGNAEVKVDVDHFGQINWIYVKDATNIYEAINAALSQAVERGGYTEFWKF